MSCVAQESYNINGVAYTVPKDATTTTPDVFVCNATKILDSLHKDFTVDLTTDTLDTNKDKPSYYLRNQPKSNSDATKTNRFYDTMVPAAGGTINDNNYKKMISVIMKGVEDNRDTYDTIPTYKITDFTDQSTEFKGIYGLNKVIEILDTKTNDLLTTLTATSIPTATKSGDAILKYNQRSDIKNTLQEIAYRENQIYREKFLNIILIVVGIILVGSQLTQKFFSGAGGGAGEGGGGLGGLFGFGVGGSGGLFSRFGGLGLGSSGRSHFDIGNLFKNSSYTLKQR